MKIILQVEHNTFLLDRYRLLYNIKNNSDGCSNRFYSSQEIHTDPDQSSEQNTISIRHKGVVLWSVAPAVDNTNVSVVLTRSLNVLRQFDAILAAIFWQSSSTFVFGQAW